MQRGNMYTTALRSAPSLRLLIQGERRNTTDPGWGLAPVGCERTRGGRAHSPFLLFVDSARLVGCFKQSVSREPNGGTGDLEGVL
jgi:hypothetical protein